MSDDGNPPAPDRNIEVVWFSDGRRGRAMEGDDLVGFIRLVNDWYEPGEREARPSWVVEWLHEGIDVLQRSLIELDGSPVFDHVEVEALTHRAIEVIEAGPPETPSPFGFSASGLGSKEAIRELIDTTIFAHEQAVGRLWAATASQDEHAVTLINIAVVEVTGWLRAVDELLSRIWRKEFTPLQRETISQGVDTVLSNGSYVPDLLAAERQERKASGEPYGDWTIALLSRHSYLPRDDLNAVRWLAGKLLHHGALSAVELGQWRMGEQPRWKWRKSSDVLPNAPGARADALRRDYDRALASRDVLGSLNFTDSLQSAELLFTVELT